MNDTPVDFSDSIPTSPKSEAATTSLLQRLVTALGPALPGIILDLVDAMSLTRWAGPFVSFPAGIGVGVWLSSYYPISWQWRSLIVLGSGLYTLTPGTEAIPLATILTCLGRFIESGSSSDSSPTATTVAAESFAEQVSEEPKTEHSAVADARRRNRSAANCPECGATTLQYGEVDMRFRPQGSSIWTKGHEIRAFVCLDCGFVGHYLATDDLSKLDPPGE